MAAEVLDRQSPAVLEFLLKTSILNLQSPAFQAGGDGEKALVVEKEGPPTSAQVDELAHLGIPKLFLTAAEDHPIRDSALSLT